MRTLALIAALLATGCRGAEPDVSAPPKAPTIVEKTAATPDPEPAPEAAQAEVHGTLTERGGQRVLHVWGTPQEMGYAHGRLLRDSIMEVLQDYALGVIPAGALTTAGMVYGTVADISPELRAEAQGIVDGMKSAGDIEIPALGRELTATDLLLVNAMTDLVAVGCSSVSAWGSATEADTTLEGSAAVVRNLDWSDEPALLRNQLLIAFEPSDPTRQPVLSVGFAGYIGCLSCVNERGVTALFNMGYGDGAADLAGAMKGFAPANLMLRDALERRDVDGDGVGDAADVEHAVRNKTHAGSYIVHVVEPLPLAAAAERAPARILEVESDGVHTRTPGGALGSTLLAATNHLRGKEGPQACSRYDRIKRTAAAAHRNFDRDDLWAMGTSVRLDEVVHSMLVRPQTRDLEVWLRRPGERASSRAKPVLHDWATTFAR
ncbi:MAG: C45 family peptidase [Myxococcota bacterium]